MRKALVEEKRKLAKSREKAIADAKAKAAATAAAKGDGSLKVPGNDMKDLFGEGSDASRAATPANGTPKASRAGTPAIGGLKEKKKGPLGAVRGISKMEDEVLGGMDLGIEDIEI